MNLQLALLSCARDGDYQRATVEIKRCGATFRRPIYFGGVAERVMPPSDRRREIARRLLKEVTYPSQGLPLSSSELLAVDSMVDQILQAFGYTARHLTTEDSAPAA
jgi:hypothetical protein